MSQFSDYAENRLVDIIRGQPWALPSQFYAALASAASDSGDTELGGSGYGRVAVQRQPTVWQPTQGGSNSAISSGTSHASSNTVAFDWGTASGDWGTASHVVLFDALSGGNMICALPLATPLAITNGTPVSFAPGSITFTLGLAGGCTDYFANYLIDFIFRGMGFSFSSMYVGLFTQAPSNAGGGTEVAFGTGYTRATVPNTLAAWAGTQGIGTTVASTGSSGQTSNNAAVSFPAPTAPWGTVTHFATFDGSGSNMLFWGPLASPKTVPGGVAPPAFQPGALTLGFA